MNTVQDKVILITGGGQGLGAATAKVLAEHGATLVLVDIKDDTVKKTADEITSAGGKAVAHSMNVGDEKSVSETFQKVVNEFGRIDVVINNAGTDVTKSVDELSFEEWDRVIKVNLRGPFAVSKTAMTYMDKSGKGHIVNIVSTAAKRTWENAAAYHASKWGLLGFSHALHTEGRKKNIKVSAVIAGGMKTPFILDRFPEAEPNLQDPRNVAETIHYVLCTPDETVIPEVMVIPMKETSWP